MDHRLPVILRHLGSELSRCDDRHRFSRTILARNTARGKDSNGSDGREIKESSDEHRRTFADWRYFLRLNSKGYGSRIDIRSTPYPSPQSMQTDAHTTLANTASAGMYRSRTKPTMMATIIPKK